MQTIKKDTCPSLSGNATISYEIGMEPDQSFWLRLVKSSGGGFLSKDWISIDAVMDTLRAAASPFTSYAIHTHFNGKSINSPGFFMAALRQEKLVVPDSIKRQAFILDNVDTALENFKGRMFKGAGSPPPKKKKAAPRKPKRK